MSIATIQPPQDTEHRPIVSGFDHDPSVWRKAERVGPRLRGAAASHVGNYRTNNEDRFLVRPDRGLFAVADGMGGHNAGEVASTLAIQALADAAGGEGAAPERLGLAIVEANADICQAGRRQASRSGMGTTLSALWFVDGRVVVGHVGDSRVYRIRCGVLEQLTEDHTLLGDAIRSGFDAERARNIFPGNVLTRAVGIRASVEPMMASFTALPGDRFLICSDGLTDMVSDEAIAGRLGLWPSAHHAAHALMNDALAAGGHDNVTVLVVDVC